MRFTKERGRCNLSSIENRRVQTGRERIAYTKSLSEISCTSPEVNAATYVDLPDSTLWKRLIIWTRSRLNRKKTPSKEDGELVGENYLIVGAQVLTGCLGPGATLVVTKFYRFQVSGPGCLRNSFHLMTAPSLFEERETLWLGVYSRLYRYL